MPRTTPGALAPTLAYYGTFVGLGLLLAALGPTLPSLAEQTGSTLGALSVVFIGRSGGYLIGVLFGGRLFDRFPGHPLMAAMLTVMALCAAAVPWVWAAWVLAVLFAALGFAEGTLDAGGNTLLTWLYPKGLGPWMNGLHFAFGVGAFVSPLLIGAVFEQGGTIGLAYRALALLLVPVILVLAVLPSPAIAAHAAEGRVNVRRHRGTIVLAAGLLFAAVGAETGYGNWIFTYSVEQLRHDPAAAAFLTSTFWGAFTVGRLLGIPVAARFEPPAILVACFVAGGAAAVLPLAAPASAQALWVSAVLGGLAVAPLFATTLALAGSRMPISGRVTGFLFVGSSAGGMIVPWVVGQLFEPVGPGSVWGVVLVDLAVGLVLCWALRRRRGASPTESGDASMPAAAP